MAPNASLPNNQFSQINNYNGKTDEVTDTKCTSKDNSRNENEDFQSTADDSDTKPLGTVITQTNTSTTSAETYITQTHYTIISSNNHTLHQPWLPPAHAIDVPYQDITLSPSVATHSGGEKKWLSDCFPSPQSTSSQPLLGQTQLRNAQPLQHHQHAHHAHLHHHHQHQGGNDQTHITYGSRANTLQGPISPGYNPNMKSSHSQISFGSNPPPPIQEGTIPMSNTHTSSPHAHSPPDPLNKSTIVHTPTTHSFADLPF